jgi:hypothetical protein
MKALDSIHALWRKLEREMYRTLHSNTKRHMADHFFNFCVSAHSMRDYYFEMKGVLQKSAQNSYHTFWNQDPVIVAVREIANLTKHFELRERSTGAVATPKTRKLVQKRGHVVDVHVSAQGDIKTVTRPAPRIQIQTSDGAQYDLWQFMVDVREYWQLYLRKEGVTLRKQPLASLLDEARGSVEHR